MKFKDYFSNNFETEDNHYLPSIRTRYYRNRVEEAKEAVVQYIKSIKGRVLDDNEQFNELLFEVPSFNCTVTFTAITPAEVSIDFNVVTFSLFPMGKGKKIIEEMYQYLDKMLQYKGVGLYKG